MGSLGRLLPTPTRHNEYFAAAIFVLPLRGFFLRSSLCHLLHAPNLVKPFPEKYFVTPLSSAQKTSRILHSISRFLSYWIQIEKNMARIPPDSGHVISEPAFNLA